MRRCVYLRGVCVKAGLERRVPQSVIINLSGMQLLFLPDKLLHGYSSLTACQVAFPSTDLSLFRAHTRTHMHTRMHGPSVTAFNLVAFWLIRVIIALWRYCVYLYHCHLHDSFLKPYPFWSKQKDHKDVIFHLERLHL